MKRGHGSLGRNLCTLFFCMLVTLNCRVVSAGEDVILPEKEGAAKSDETDVEGKQLSNNGPSTEKSNTSGNALLYGGIGIAVVGAVLAAAGSGGGSDSAVDSGTAATPVEDPPPQKKEEKKESRPKITTPKDENPPDSKPVGPDIRGGDWSGYLDLVHGVKENVTASISQNGNHVIITTSSNQEYGRKFIGNINESGSIRVYDQRTGELWTTHEGPATKKRIDLYDYVDHYQALDRLYLER